MRLFMRPGEKARKWRQGVIPPLDLCEVCGGEMDYDPESKEGHCPVCESPETWHEA